MVFDGDFIYAGNRGTFRFAPPNPDIDTQELEGIVVFSATRTTTTILIDWVLPNCSPQINFYRVNIPMYTFQRPDVGSTDVKLL